VPESGCKLSPAKLSRMERVGEFSYRRLPHGSTHMNVRQVSPWRQWPSGDNRPIAVLPIDAATLSDRYGLAFVADIDDLDRYHLAAIALSDGQQAWLIRYEGDPGPGTVVLVDGAADIEAAQSALAKALGLERDAFLWAAPVPASTS